VSLVACISATASFEIAVDLFGNILNQSMGEALHEHGSDQGI
jgi:hypothetical protein